MFNGFYLTYKGQEYIAKALTGKALSITRGQFGNGSIGSGIPNERTSLVSPRGDLTISKKEVSENRLTITTQFSNRVNGSILPDFYLTEAGIYGKVLNADGTTDSAETLIAYAYCNQSDADYIQQVLTEFILNWPMVISSEANVEVTIDESLVYPTLEEYNHDVLILKTGTVEVLRGTNAVISNLSEEKGMVDLSIYGKSVQDGTPAPDVPVEIVSVENPEVKVCGKNLINIVRGGTTVTVTETVENGMVSFSGTATGSGGRTAWGRSDVITLTPGRYTLSMVVPSGTAGNPILTIAGTTTVAGSLGSFTIKETTDVYFGFNYENGVTYNAQNVKVQLERGDVATEYEPYNEPQTLSIPHTLRGIPVSSGGNYTDADGQQWICDEVDLERGVLVQRVGSKTFKGSEDEIWYSEMELDTTAMFRTGITDSVNVGNVVGNDFICTHFKATNMYNTDITGAQHTMQQFYFRLSKTVMDTVDLNGFRNLLATSPMTVSYELATPIEIPLTADILNTHYPVTNIFVTDGIDVDFEAKIRTRSYANKFPFETVGIDTVLSDDVDYGGYHKVCDKVPTLEQLQKGGTISFNECTGRGIETMNYPEGDMMVMSITNGAVIAYNGLTLVVVAFENGATYFGNTFNKGVYFMQDTTFAITHSLTINGFTGFKSPDMRPIPLEYMPKEVLTEITGVTRAEFDALDAQVTYTAMMTDTLSEEV